MTRDPAAEGFRMPPEWAPHEATWMAWPRDPRTWVTGIEAAEQAYVDMIAALVPGERVELLVDPDGGLERAHDRLSKAGLDVDVPDGRAEDPPASGVVRLHPEAYVDSWVRDTGPTVLVREDGARLAVDWRFDAWGGKYDDLLADDRLGSVVAERAGIERVRVDTVLEGGAIDVDEEGLLLTTEQCLLNPNRGADRTRASMEEILARYVGAEEVIWLGEGIQGDDTDGHVDTVARFVGPGEVLACVQEDANDPDHGPLAANLERLEERRDAGGDPLEVHTVPMPEPVEREGARLPASYANFYVGNDAVLVPVFGCPQDQIALDALGSIFPQRRVVAIEARDLVVGFGACHCLTQPIPAAP